MSVSRILIRVDVTISMLFISLDVLLTETDKKQMASLISEKFEMAVKMSTVRV